MPRKIVGVLVRFPEMPISAKVTASRNAVQEKTFSTSNLPSTTSNCEHSA